MVLSLEADTMKSPLGMNVTLDTLWSWPGHKARGSEVVNTLSKQTNVHQEQWQQEYATSENLQRTARLTVCILVTSESAEVCINNCCTSDN